MACTLDDSLRLLGLAPEPLKTELGGRTRASPPPEPLKLELCALPPPPPPGLEDLSPVAASEASTRSSPSGTAPSASPSAARQAQEPVKLARTAGGCLVVTLVDGMLAPSPWKTSGAAAMGTDCQSTASGGQSPCSAPEDEAEEEAPKKKKKSRFCKAKRDHYRRLVEQLVQSFQDDPDNFSLDGVKLPRSIAICEESKKKLLATVTKFAAGIDTDC